MTAGFFIFVAVRLKSTRLHKKALLDIGNKSVIAHLIDRLTLVYHRNQVGFARLIRIGRALVALAEKLEVLCFRGHAEDVMLRF